MKTITAQPGFARVRSVRERGSILVIVLWIAFGLVSLTLFFGHSMMFEFRASDNTTAAVEANQAIEGAARYVAYLLSNPDAPGILPDQNYYQRAEVPVGEALFWLVGRSETENTLGYPYFAVVDEASKLNLNTVTVEMLEQLPLMTPELAAAIVDWRDSDSDVTTNGAESETYSASTPSYTAKNANFESVDELRMLNGAYHEIVYGEDSNRNGILDPNENDGDLSPPLDNQDGRLDPGVIEYFTVFSREPSKRLDGTALINVSTVTRQQGGQNGGQNGGQQGGQGGETQGNTSETGVPQDLPTLLTERLGEARANEILSQFGNNATNTSVLQFYIRSGMTTQEFDQIAGDITVATADYTPGLVNVNTASETVLACLPGIGWDKASSLIARRQQNASLTNSVAWVAEVLDQESAIQAGPYLTSRSFQYTADVAAVGHYGRGYKRTQFVFDAAEGYPKIIYRRDMTGFGWALGQEIRERLRLANADNTLMMRRTQR